MEAGGGGGRATFWIEAERSELVVLKDTNRKPVTYDVDAISWLG